jgi:hypothetical protein
MGPAEAAGPTRAHDESRIGRHGGRLITFDRSLKATGGNDVARLLPAG